MDKVRSGQADRAPAARTETSEATAAVRGLLFGTLIGSVFGRSSRVAGAFLIGVGGLLLVLAWTEGPQKIIEAARYGRYTGKVEARIVESWVALELNTARASESPNWRAHARATPCAVVEYAGDWDAPIRRSFCGPHRPLGHAFTLHGLTELVKGVPFAWQRDASGLIVPEIRIRPSARDWLSMNPRDDFLHGRWPAQSALDELMIELDRPVDQVVVGWVAPPSPLALAFDPQDRQGALPAAYVDARREWSPWLLVVPAILGCMGLLVWFEGVTVLLGNHIPLAARAFVAACFVLALPWWGDAFGRAVSELNAQWGEVFSEITGDIQRARRLEATAPEAAVLANGRRLAWRAGTGVYRDTFGRLALSPPPAASPSADAALERLVDAATRQTRAMDVPDRIALFQRLADDKRHDLRKAAMVFVPAAKEALLETRADAPLHLAAQEFLTEWVTRPIEVVDRGDLGWRKRMHLYAILADVPVPEIASMVPSFAADGNTPAGP